MATKNGQFSSDLLQRTNNDMALSAQCQRTDFLCSSSSHKAVAEAAIVSWQLRLLSEGWVVRKQRLQQTSSSHLPAVHSVQCPLLIAEPLTRYSCEQVAHHCRWKTDHFWRSFVAPLTETCRPVQVVCRPLGSSPIWLQYLKKISSHLSCFRNFRLQSCVIKQTTV